MLFMMAMGMGIGWWVVGYLYLVQIRDMHSVAIEGNSEVHISMESTFYMYMAWIRT